MGDSKYKGAKDGRQPLTFTAAFASDASHLLDCCQCYSFMHHRFAPLYALVLVAVLTDAISLLLADLPGECSK